MGEQWAMCVCVRGDRTKLGKDDDDQHTKEESYIYKKIFWCVCVLGFFFIFYFFNKNIIILDLIFTNRITFFLSISSFPFLYFILRHIITNNNSHIREFFF